MHPSYPPGCQLYAIVFQKFGAAVCTENLIRFDLVTESLKRRPRWVALLLETVGFAVQVERPT
jgi:hypothetical protein